MRQRNYPSNTVSLALTVIAITTPLAAFYQESSPVAHYEHSKPQSFIYAARTLRWFTDARGGRSSSHDKIGFDSAEGIIIHRYFHYLDQKQDFKAAIRCHKRLQKLLKEKMERNFTFINFARDTAIDDERGPIDTCIAILHPELYELEPYRVMENKYQTHITDRSGTTYTLFKSHALTK